MRYLSVLRIISAVTLFFALVILPLYSLVAYAAEPARMGMRISDCGMKPEPATVYDCFRNPYVIPIEAKQEAFRGEDDTRERDIIKVKQARSNQRILSSKRTPHGEEAEARLPKDPRSAL
jgi:hypothetical protein